MLKNLINYLKSDDYLIGIYDKKIYVFNYVKLFDINSNNIKIKLNNKRINISGENLVIKKLENNELLIEGTHKEIKFYE